MACVGEFCSVCEVWFDPEGEDHNHDDPDFEDPPYADAYGEVVAVLPKPDRTEGGG